MEIQLNIDFKNNLSKTICWILSLLSWCLFVLTGWIGFFKLSIKKYNKHFSYNNIWSFINTYFDGDKSNETKYYPIQLKRGFYIFLFGLLVLCGTIGFAFYIMKTIFKKDEHVFEGMMGTYSRYHFSSLICATALFIIGMTQKLNLSYITDEPKKEDKISDKLDEINKFFNSFTISLCFSILGLISLVFIKKQTKIEKPDYIVYTIIEGVYSILISLFTYSFFYSSIYIGVFSKVKKAYNMFKNNFADLPKSLEILASINKFMKDCGITFSLLIGIINISIGIFFNEIGIPLTNLIIYLGLTVYFFLMNKDYRDNEGVSSAEGIIDIIFLVLSCCAVGLGGYNKFKNKKSPK